MNWNGSHVVLICVKPYVTPHEITEQDLVSVISEFVPVVKISIFNTDPIIKAFVEFADPQTASLVVNQFSNRLLPIGSVRAYSSKKPHISLQKKEKSCRFKNQTKVTFLTAPDRKSSGGFSNFTHQEAHSSKNPIVSSSSQLPLEKTTSSPVAPPLSFHRLAPQFSARGHHDLSNNDLAHEFHQLCLNPSTSEDKSVGFISHKLTSVAQEQAQSFEPVHYPRCPDNSSAFPSRFLAIKNMNFKIANNKIITNLLCLFGNINRIVVDRIENCIVVEYFDSTESGWAYYYLHDQPFFGKVLRLYNDHQTVANLLGFLEERATSEVLIGHSEDFRYKQGLKIKFNAPSPMLHFTNLSENCTPEILFQIVCAVHEPTKIVKLSSRSYAKTPMMLVEFESVTSSLEALVVFHNKLLDGRPVRVSFSQTKVMSAHALHQKD